MKARRQRRYDHHHRRRLMMAKSSQSDRLEWKGAPPLTRSEVNSLTYAFDFNISYTFHSLI